MASVAKSKRWLPLEWWKLSLLWFLNLKSRSPRSEVALFPSSLKVALLGLSLGVASLSLTLMIVTGFERTLAKAVIQSSGHITHHTQWRTFAELESLASKAPAGVEAVEYFWNGQALLVGPAGGRGVLVEGRRRVKLDDRHGLDSNGIRPFPGISLGAPLAKQLGVGVGDSVRLLVPGVTRAPFTIKVEKILRTGMYETDSRLALLDDTTFRDLIKEKDPEAYASRPGDAHGIRYFLDSKLIDGLNPRLLDQWVAEYRLTTAQAWGDKDPQMIRTWFDLKKNFFGSIGFDKAVLSMIVALLTLVASLNVAASLIVLYLERDREMAVLQAIGMSRRLFVQWFLVQGLILGLLASLIGLGLGQVMGMVLVKLPIARLPEEIYNLSQLPLGFERMEQGLVFLFGALVTTAIAAGLGLRLSATNLVSVLSHRR